jgi:hypothetical protein
MRSLVWPALLLAACVIQSSCEEDSGGPARTQDLSGTYCIEAQQARLLIDQVGDRVTFTLSFTAETSGSGTVEGQTVMLTGAIPETDTLTAVLVFADDGQSFSGTFLVHDASGSIAVEGTLDGVKGDCATHDVEIDGIPRFVGSDYTRLAMIHSISRFRSAAGHSYTDRFESCRSMKHYYAPMESYRRNNTVPIYAPATGTIVAVWADGHGASIGLSNKQIILRPESQPAFRFWIFHTDLVSSEVAAGTHVEAGELIGHARLYYDDLGEYGTSFDIAVTVNTPAGVQLVSYFDTMTDTLFSNYRARGVTSREDLVISREARDSDPLECEGETFISNGTIESWVVLD